MSLVTIRNELIKMIEKAKRLPIPVDEQANLYTDLGFDSLTFVSLLVGIEEKYAIIFELMEMAVCLQVDKLIALVETKVGEYGDDAEKLAD